MIIIMKPIMNNKNVSIRNKNGNENDVWVINTDVANHHNVASETTDFCFVFTSLSPVVQQQREQQQKQNDKKFQTNPTGK